MFLFNRQIILLFVCFYTIYNTLPYRAWSSIVIVHGKSGFLLFFRNISKTAETILIKKIGRNHGITVYKKSLISEHRKNYVFRDNGFVKMSVTFLDCF